MNTLKNKVKKNTDQIDTNFIHNEDELEKIESANSFLQTKIELNEQKINDINKKLEDINVQLIDSNFSNIENNKEKMAEGTNGTVSSEVAQNIQNLEKKMFKKFEFVDDKYKKSEEVIMKLKHDFHVMQGQLEVANGNLNELKVKVDDNTNNLSKNQNELEEKLNTLSKELKDKEDELKSLIESEVKR